MFVQTNEIFGLQNDKILYLNTFVVNFPFDFEGRMWDLVVSVPEHCLYFHFDCIGS